MYRLRRILIILICFFSSLPLLAQEPVIDQSYPTGGAIIVNEGETLVYRLSHDHQAQKGTVSDALQNVPGVKVDTEGKISLRGVSQVELFINGKPSHFDEESLKNYLQQVSAASIERIEVMTNPSAQYTSASGTGIINLITNNHSERHLSIGVQTNTQPNLSPWVSYIWNNDKWSFNVNVKGDYSSTKEKTESYSYSFVDHEENEALIGMDTSSIVRRHGNDTAINYSAEVFLKAEYRPNPKNDFMVYSSFSPSKSYTSSLSNIYRKEYIDDIGEYRYSIQRESIQPFNYGSAGMAWTHRFDHLGQALGMQLFSDFDYGVGLNKEKRVFENQPELNRDIVNNFDFTDIGYNAKIEYTHPYVISPVHHHGDIYVSFTDVLKPDNNIAFYDTLGPNGYVTDWLRSENRRFNRRQAASTVMVQHHIGHAITLKAGISWENTWIKSHYLDTPEYDTLIRFDYWKPSLHLTFRTPSAHNLSLSYTRKTNYPWVRYFTSKKNYDEESFSVGNPKLKPTLIDVFELSWAKYSSLGSVSVKGYYNNSINAINQVSDAAYDPIWNRVVPYSKPVNLNKYYEAGSEFNITYRPSSTFNIRLDANIYDSYIETKYEKTQDSIICSELWAYNIKLSTWAKLWNKFEFHATAYYNSPTQTLFATNQTAYGIDCGFRADFFDKKFSVLFNAFDIFNWNREDNYTFNPYYISYSSNKANSRYVSLELVYRVL